MKILHAASIHSDRSSGVTVYALELLRALVAEGSLEVGLLPTRAGTDPLGHAAIPGCVLLDPPARRHLNPWRVSDSWLDRIEKGFGRPDLVHFHSVYDPFHTALARRFRERGWKYAVSPHGAFQGQAQSNKRLKKTLGNLLFLDGFMRRAEAVFASSLQEKAFVDARYPGIRSFVHANAVSTEFLARTAALPAAPARGGRSFTVGYVGRLDVYHKGLDILVRAIERLEADAPGLDVRFVLVGPYHRPEDERTLRAMHAALKRPERVLFPGPKHGDAKLEALAGFDAFIHTSRHEGMPAAILEAMAASKPCILTPGTNLQHIASEHGAGWSCEGDPASIAAAIREAALADPAELARRGSRARRFVEERMTWPVLAREYAKEVRALLS